MHNGTQKRSCFIIKKSYKNTDAYTWEERVPLTLEDKRECTVINKGNDRECALPNVPGQKVRAIKKPSVDVGQKAPDVSGEMKDLADLLATKTLAL